MLSEMSKESLEMLSYAKIAELYLKENKKPMNTADLFKEVCKLLKLSDEEYVDNIADFFESLTTSKEFILLEDGTWDLKSNHKVKVVIEDIEYEIYLTGSYINNLSAELKRFKQIENYRHYMEKAKSQKNKNYYLEGMKVLFRDGETLENYMDIYNEYQNAYNARKAIIEDLYKEIKIIKKLKV